MDSPPLSDGAEKATVAEVLDPAVAEPMVGAPGAVAAVIATHVAYKIIFAVGVIGVPAVYGVPEPLASVFHPIKR
jgi:hypothetical protein